MALHLLAAAFAALMLARHGPAALSFLARGAPPGARWRALPSFLTAVVALLLLLGSLTLLARQRA
jgi:hypothetical protein